MIRRICKKPNSIRLHLRSVGLLLGSLLVSGWLAENARAQTGVEVLGTLDGVARPGLNQRNQTTDRESTLEAVPEGFATTVISPGFLLELDVFDIPELTGITLRVDAGGNVTVPSLGSLHLQGETLPAAEATITKALVDGEILIAPQVKLNVLQYAAQSVTVLGEVSSPGRIRVLEPRTLDEIVGMAGGETISAGNDIEIQRTGPDGKMQVAHVQYTLERHSLGQTPTLVYPGDSVLVHRAGVVYVLGAVGKPGAYLMVNGGMLNVLQGVTLAGGTLLNASTRELRILRPEGGSYRSIEVPYSKLVEGKAESVQLQANDILYVARSRFKTTVLDGSYLLGTTISGGIYRIP